MGHAAHELVDDVDEQLGIGAGEVLHRVVSLFLARALNSSMVLRALEEAFTLATQASKPAWSWVAMALNFMPEKPAPL